MMFAVFTAVPPSAPDPMTTNPPRRARNSGQPPRRGRVPVLLLVLIAVAAGAAVAARILTRPPPPGAVVVESVRVAKQTVDEVLQESGTLIPRDPVLVSAPFDGKLQFVIEDQSWVKVGDILMVINDEEEQRKLGEFRTQLADARQQKELAQLRRQLVEEQEDAKVATANRELALEEARSLILTTPAKGGMELARLADAMAPLVAKTQAARLAVEQVRSRYQAAQDGFLDALDAVQDQEDSIARAETRLDEVDTGNAANSATSAVLANAAAANATATAGAVSPVSTTASSSTAGSATAPDLATLRAEVQRLRGALPALAASLERARTARDRVRPELASAEADLAAAEAEERPLRVALEVERRALPATRLAINLRLAQAELEEANRKLKEADAALKVQAISAAARDDRAADAESAAAKVRLTKARLDEASLPPGKEQLAEAEARLTKARATVEGAAAAKQRAIGIAEAEVLVQTARIARIEAQIGRSARRFVSTLDIELADARRLRDRARDETTRQAATARIAALEADLVQAQTNPPGTLTATAEGLVVVRREGNRQKLAGDQIWQADLAAEIFPPGNFAVEVKVNEANVARLKPGLKVDITVPALGNRKRTGTIERVAGVGRDKHDGTGRPLSGVTQFAARVVLDGKDPSDSGFRQGMTVQVAITLRREADCLAIPRAAARPDPSKPNDPTAWQVRPRAEGPWQPITATPVGATWLQVLTGLAEGDTVVMERRMDE
jgi:multidrug efflux pump subunit AcrA (membrane-fusion protein)